MINNRTAYDGLFFICINLRKQNRLAQKIRQGKCQLEIQIKCVCLTPLYIVVWSDAHSRVSIECWREKKKKSRQKSPLLQRAYSILYNSRRSSYYEYGRGDHPSRESIHGRQFFIIYIHIYTHILYIHVLV